MKGAFDWSRCGGRERALDFHCSQVTHSGGCCCHWLESIIIKKKKVFHYEKLPFIFLVHGGTRTMENLENWHRLELDIVIQWESVDLTCPRLWSYEFSPQHCKSRAKQKATNNMKEEPVRSASGERFARCLKWVWALGYTQQQSCPLTSNVPASIQMHTHKCNKTIERQSRTQTIQITNQMEIRCFSKQGHNREESSFHIPASSKARASQSQAPLRLFFKLLSSVNSSGPINYGSLANFF